jgi:hypothetical protein
MGATDGDKEDDHEGEEVRCPLLTPSIYLQNTPFTLLL